MFNLFESSRSRSKPFHMYLFKYGPGSGDFYAFTDNEFPVRHQGIDYSPRQIDHGGISTTGSLDRAALEVRTPRTNELFLLFRAYPPSYRVTLSVLKSHYGDPDKGVVAIWSGRILGMDVRGSECTFNGEPISTTMKRLGLRRNWQYGCPHALYQNGCRADRNRVMQSATVVSNDGGVIALQPNWNGPIAPEKFNGGYIETRSSTALTRSILRVTGDSLILTGDTSDLTVGVGISVYPGCAHNMADCQGVHDNILNFGGQPWIPLSNPVGSKNNFY